MNLDDSLDSLESKLYFKGVPMGFIGNPHIHTYALDISVNWFIPLNVRLGYNVINAFPTHFIILKGVVAAHLLVRIDATDSTVYYCRKIYQTFID